MRVIDLNNMRQSFDFDCGVKALQTVFAFYGDDIQAGKLMQELKTSPEDGTQVRRIIKTAKAHGYKVKASKDLSYKQLRKLVSDGYPAIVLVQAWAERVMTPEDWAADWDDSHYAIVIGLDDDKIVFEDPASIRRVWLPKKEFLIRWHGKDFATNEKFKNLAIILHKKKTESQDQVVRMK